jgi:hypothetical protein
MLTARARRPILLLLAALITVLAAVGVGVTVAPAAHAAGVQNRVRAFIPAAQPRVGSTSTRSPCSRPDQTVPAARIAVGFCVAAEGPTLIGPAGDAAASGLSRIDRFKALAQDGISVGDEDFSINDHVINSLRKSGRRGITPEDLIDALGQEPTPGEPGSVVYTNPQTGTNFFVNPSTNQVVGVHPEGFR